MDKIALRDFLLEKLPNAKLASGSSQIRCQCAMCNDNDAHCYIGPFDDDESTPVLYNCFHCSPATEDRSGYVNQEFMNRYNLWLPDQFKYKTNGVKAVKKRITGRTVLNLESKYLTPNESTEKKLNYINQRLGLNLTYEDTLRLKLILNLSDLLNGNQVFTYTRNIKDMEDLDTYFIGCIGVNNNMLSLRNMCYEGIKAKGGVKNNAVLNCKYVNYVVNNSMDADKFYVIPTTLNLFDRVRVHVCEGFMDALGIYFNLYNCESHNDIFIAGFGKSYIESVSYFLSHTAALDVEVHMYPDLDVYDRDMKDAVSFLSPLVDTFYIHRNAYVDPNTGKREKDFGVPRERIVDSCVELK